ncbi:MAG: hypothetical protein KF690_07075 [Bacteroidetes bacterium]|nr:hypothetical protein [Bacteroidota bacterium]
MKLRVAKVTYTELEIPALYLTLLENELKPLFLGSLNASFPVFTTSEAAVASRLEHDKRSANLLVAELKLKALNPDNITADGTNLSHKGTLSIRHIQSFTSVTLAGRKGKGRKKKKV